MGHVAHLDWVTELLNMPAAAALALLDGSLDQSLATQSWHKAMFQVSVVCACVGVARLVGGREEGGCTPQRPQHAVASAFLQAIAAVTSSVYDLIKASVRESWLVVLTPGQTVWQSGTMVLIQVSARC